MFYLTGKFNKAIEYYQKSLTIEHSNPHTLLNLAFIHYELGNFNIAKEYYFKAILFDPTVNREEYKVIAKHKDE